MFLDRFRSKAPGREAHDIFHIPGLIYQATGPQGGHTRLFRKPLKGVSVFAWNCFGPEWPMVRRWYLFGLATLIHVKYGTLGEDRSTSKEGWQIRWRKLSIKRVYGGFAVTCTLDRGYSA